jgi:membrane protein YqaA with SNARE-associated domain
MTIIEAGVIGGSATGAVVGGVVCKSQPALWIAAGALAGAVLGAVVGWVYALVVICLLSVVGVLWRAARKRADMTPTETEMERMSPVAVFGTFVGILTALAYCLIGGWLHALVAALAIAMVVALLAVARCELR